MGFWSRLFGRKSSSSLELFREVYGGGRMSTSGKLMTVDAMIEDATAWACMRVISEGGSQVPWNLLQETSGRKTVAKDHRLHELLHVAPNEWQTSFEFRETLYLHLLVAGNAYAFVNKVGRARETGEILLIEPRFMTVKRRPDLSLEYTVTNDRGERRVLGSDAIWHVRGPSWNTWSGLDALKMARNAIGLSASIEQGQAEFQKNGAASSGVYSVPDRLDEEQFEQLDAWFARHVVGGDRAHMPLIVDRGAKFEQNAFSGVDQQLLETRRHQVEDICRRFRVMPLMVGHPADMAARAATESIFLQHVVHTLMPWYERLEQSANLNLLTREERQAGYYTKFNANALMRGAAKDRAEYYAKALGAGGAKGWMTQNQVIALEDMDPSDDPKADELPQPPVKPNPNEKPQP